LVQLGIWSAADVQLLELAKKGYEKMMALCRTSSTALDGDLLVESDYPAVDHDRASERLEADGT
jgi:hypothetical protein